MMMIQPAIHVAAGGLRRTLAVCAALLFIVGCGDRPSEDILDRITGTWETDAPGYENARLEISREKVIFYAVDDSVLVNRIADISHTQDKKGDLLTIEYRNRWDQKYLLTFYILASPDGDTLVKKNQQHIIWRKKTGGQ